MNVALLTELGGNRVASGPTVASTGMGGVTPADDPKWTYPLYGPTISPDWWRWFGSPVVVFGVDARAGCR